MELYCSNPECHWHTEHRGGHFIHMKARNGRLAGFYCEDCVRLDYGGNSGKNIWEFDTTNISGKPIHVQGLQHLRQLEKQYGVRSVIANMDERHWNTQSEGRA